MWYRAGTVAVTNGNAVVTGTGTDFVAGIQIGAAFQGPDGRTYEVASIQSSTQLTLAANYQGATAGGQAYAIQPTSSFARDLALAAGTLIGSFADVRDGIGQGLIPDGTVGAPAIRFAGDQDTGFYRIANNIIGFVTAGVERMRLNPATGGSIVDFKDGWISNDSAGGAAFIGKESGSNTFLIGSQKLVDGADSGLSIFNYTEAPTRFFTLSALRMTLDVTGNLLVGVTSSEGYGSGHRISKTVDEGTGVLSVDGGGEFSSLFFAVDSAGYNASATGVFVGKNSTTSRSINAGGTVNASGADYAEYMTKADGCGTIAPGDVCGVDTDGKLTKTWSAAKSFVIKSTNPSYVGGDTWAAHLPSRPQRTDDETDAAFATREASWNADLETARQTVDRIAFAGQVPVNATGDFAIGDYLIAAANGGGIQAVAVAEVDITFDQYRRRLGKVWASRDGKAWVDVQHG